MGAFKEVLKMDEKTRITIKRVLRRKYQENSTSSEMVQKLVEMLINENVAQMMPIAQVYWMYSVRNIILTMEDSTLLRAFEKKLKDITLPHEYSILLDPFELNCLSDLLLTPLIKIINCYHGPLNREFFIEKFLSFEAPSRYY